MSTIHSIATNPALQPQGTPELTLGTEGFDFLSTLLGLQANQPTEWWQQLDGALEKEPQEQKESEFGQVAAMPLADMALSALKPDALPATKVEVPALRLETQVPESLAMQAVRTAESLQGAERRALDLLAAPLEGKQSFELKELVDSIWGQDLRSVKIEESTPEVSFNSSQHEVLKATALPQKMQVQTASDAGSQQELAEDSVAMQSIAVEPGREKPVQSEKKSRSDVSMNLGPVAEKHTEKFSLEDMQPVTPQVHATKTPVAHQVLPSLSNLAAQGGGKMTLELDPPEMGRLTIEVSTRGKHVEVTIRSDNDQTRAALESSMPDLQQALNSADLQLTHAEVKSGSESSFASLNFGKNQGGGEQSSGEGRESGFQRQSPEPRFEPAFQKSVVARHVPTGRLDFRV